MNDDERFHYGRARTAGGLALIALAMLLTLLDAASVDYQLDSIQLGLILGTAGVLLGVEAVRRVVG